MTHDAPLRIFVVRRQTYRELAGTVPHRTRAGVVLDLVQLATECPDCGGPFVALATEAAAMAGNVTRRCPACRAVAGRRRVRTHAPDEPRKAA